MKNKIAAAVLLSALIFTGCQGKNIQDTNKSAVSPVSQEQTSGSISSNTATGNRENSDVSEAGSNKTDSIQNNLKPVQPGTVPKLNQSQKSQINSKVMPVINNIKDSLKSLEDVKDINLN
ncbi:hypothetical protein JK636_12700 [Clostridium sp. YIM B02515]|uniref:Lipoprotein n=1 Tax=Clostridium rhizosphaerae TaxID=2803861 RepID=A0ABS1TB80_9CLOT|nr:hypothetical protein [Clostridium rhizosphaerae]MBL4936618.1 hypothetical protein [Clostridium rhizosphaerae]